MEIERAKELIKAIIDDDRVAAVLMVLEEHSRSVSTKLDNLALENMRRELDEVKMELKDTHKQFEVLAGIIEEHQRCHIESERRESVKEKTMEAVEKIKERNKKGTVVNGIHHPAKEEQVDNRICKKCGKSFYSESLHFQKHTLQKVYYISWHMSRHNCPLYRIFSDCCSL